MNLIFEEFKPVGEIEFVTIYKQLRHRKAEVGQISKYDKRWVYQMAFLIPPDRDKFRPIEYDLLAFTTEELDLIVQKLKQLNAEVGK